MLSGTSHLSLLTGPIAISIASRDAALRPSVAHAYGCRFSEGGARIRVFLLRDESRQILRDVAANGEVATVYSDVRSFRSLQIKGRNAAIEPFDAADAAAQAQHHRITSEELMALGYAPSMARNCFSVPHHAELATITFAPLDIFQQTPGPGAGDRLTAGTVLTGGRR